MKKIIAIIMMLTMIMSFVGCSQTDSVKTTKLKNQIAIRELNEDEKNMLTAFDLDGKSALYDFNTPKDAKSITIYVETLNENNEWEQEEIITTELDAAMSPEAKSMNGNISFIFNRDHSFKFTLMPGDGSKIALESTVPEYDGRIFITGSALLSEIKDITLGEKIVLAIESNSLENKMKACAVSDYYNLENITKNCKMLLRAVTVVFN